MPQSSSPFAASSPEGRPRRVGRVQLQDRVRPELALGQLVPDEPLDPLVIDVDEALDVVPVLADHPVPKLEDVEGHERLPISIPGSVLKPSQAAALATTSSPEARISWRT